MENLEKKSPEIFKEEIKEKLLSFAQESDIKDMTTLWFSELAQDGRHLKDDARRLRQKEYESRLKDPNNFFLVCKIADQLAGYVHYYIETNEFETKEGENVIGWIKTIAVSNEYKNRKIGSELLEQAEKDLLNRGVKCLYIKTRAEKEFYEKNGFENFAIILKKNI